MAFDTGILSRAILQYEADLEKKKQERQQKKEQIYTALPRTREIDRALRSTMGQIVAAAFKRGSDPTVALERVKAENLSLQRERAELLVGNGYPYDALEDKAFCPLCNDSGYAKDGPCRCLLSYYTREQNKELSKLLDLGSQSFDTFDFKWYSDTYWPKEQSSPRENMEIVYELCANYAHNFSRKSTNLLMTGAPGLGKTFLSACIAREVTEQGYSVVYDTASHIFSQFERGKFGRESQFDEDAELDINRCLSCDLLIMDDLGSEMTTAFVISALYQIINTRMMTGKKTILNTNLPLADLGKRYGAAILSRIEGEYQILTFFGEDIRKQRSHLGL